MGKIIWMLGFCSLASWRNRCTARCCSIWYRLFIATLSFSWRKIPSAHYGRGVESRYFLRINGHPQGSLRTSFEAGQTVCGVIRIEGILLHPCPAGGETEPRDRGLMRERKRPAGTEWMVALTRELSYARLRDRSGVNLAPGVFSVRSVNVNPRRTDICRCQFLCCWDFLVL